MPQTFTFQIKKKRKTKLIMDALLDFAGTYEKAKKISLEIGSPQDSVGRRRIELAERVVAAICPVLKSSEEPLLGFVFKVAKLCSIQSHSKLLAFVLAFHPDKIRWTITASSQFRSIPPETSPEPFTAEEYASYVNELANEAKTHIAIGSSGFVRFIFRMIASTAQYSHPVLPQNWFKYLRDAASVELLMLTFAQSLDYTGLNNFSMLFYVLEEAGFTEVCVAKLDEGQLPYTTLNLLMIFKDHLEPGALKNWVLLLANSQQLLGISAHDLLPKLNEIFAHDKNDCKRLSSLLAKANLSTIGQCFEFYVALAEFGILSGFVEGTICPTSLDDLQNLKTQSTQEGDLRNGLGSKYFKVMLMDYILATHHKDDKLRGFSIIVSKNLMSMLDYALNPKDSVDLKYTLFQLDFKEDWESLEALKVFTDDCMKADAKTYFSPYSSIVQGSGMGKTRLACELARYYDVIYINLRMANSTGIPSRSLIVDEILKLKYEFEAVLLFVATVEVYYEQVSNNQFEWLREMITNDNAANGFWITVQQRYNLLKADWWRENSEKIIDARSGQHKSLVNNTPTQNMYCDEFNRVRNSNRKLVLVLDEARSLITESTPTVFSLVRRSFKVFGPDFFAYLLDTVSKISNFSPQIEIDPSARSSTGGQLFEPFYFLPNIGMFHSKSINYNSADIIVASASEGYMPRTVDVKELCALSRPMFYVDFLGRINPNQDNRMKGFGMVIDFAQFKLGLGSLYGKFGDELQRAAKLVLMFIRCGVFAVDAAINETAISQFMGSAFYVSESRSTVLACFPSEPVLAEAVSKHFLSKLKPKLEECVDELAKFLGNGYFLGHSAKGEYGELIASIILLDIFDQAQMSLWEARASSADRRIFSAPLPVEHFIEYLMRTAHSATDVNYRRFLLTAKTKYVGGFVGFTHFVQMGRSASAADLLECYKRRAAIKCKRNQEAYDFIIPVLKGKLASAGGQPHEMDVDDMMCIVLQIKNSDTIKSGIGEAIARKLASEGLSCELACLWSFGQRLQKISTVQVDAVSPSATVAKSLIYVEKGPISTAAFPTLSAAMCEYFNTIASIRPAHYQKFSTSLKRMLPSKNESEINTIIKRFSLEYRLDKWK